MLITSNSYSISGLPRSLLVSLDLQWSLVVSLGLP